MPATISPPEIGPKPKRPGAGGGGLQGGGWGDDSPEGWGSYGPPYGSSPQAYRLGMMLGLASILMLFVALSSAYVVRQGVSQDWHPIALPPWLLPNTFVLLVSSLTLELARRSLKRRLDDRFRGWITLTTLLGITFLLGQIAIWQSLAAQGIYLSSNPHSSFFYLMTGAHGVHLLGGMLALSYVMSRAWRHKNASQAGWTVLDVTALYWHFMDGLWIYLFFLLFVWR